MKKLSNLFALTRPLSSIKNVLIVYLAFFISNTEINWFNFILGAISLSLVSSAIYAFNTFCDFKIDKENENKEHYSKSVSFLGERKISFIITTLITLGLLIGLMINYYFLLSLILLILFNFLYSSPRTRFKEKIILDILIAGIFAFGIRFVAAWFLFKISFPPLLPILALIFAKSGGYMLYKEMDRVFLIEQGIKNSITSIKENTVILISGLLYAFSLISVILLCLNGRYFNFAVFGYLPFNFLFMVIFALPPILIIYLKFFGRIRISVKNLRILGLLYGLAVLIITLFSI